MLCVSELRSSIIKKRAMCYVSMLLNINKFYNKQTCEACLQLLTLIEHNAVGGGNEGAAWTVNTQLQTQVPL